MKQKRKKMFFGMKKNKETEQSKSSDLKVHKRERRSFSRLACVLFCVLICLLVPIVFHYASLAYYTRRINTLTLEREQARVGQPTKPIAVIMTTYNRADLLPRALDSILNQTFADFDFLIVDDGSTDSSLKLLYSYMQKDKRIRVYPQKKRGIFFSRNRLLSLADNKYVAIMDSDDYSFPQRLEKQYAYLEKNPDITVVSAQSTTFTSPDQLSVRWVQYERELAEYFFRKCPLMDDSTMFRLDFIRQNALSYNPAVAAGEDYRFWVKILEKGGRFGLVETPLLRFREHQTNGKSYYDIMSETVKEVREEFYRLFLKPDTKPVSLCECILNAREVNKTKHFFTPEQMDFAVSQWCPGPDQKVLGYFIMTDTDSFAWRDYVIINENPYLLYLFKTKEPVVIKKQTPDEIQMDTPLFKDLIFVPLPGTDYWIQKDGS